MDKKYLMVLGLMVFTMALLGPELAQASVESTLTAIQSKLINVILPLAGILGIVFASFSFFAGNPGAKSHFILAIIGAVIGFGSPSIIAFVRGLIH